MVIQIDEISKLFGTTAALQPVSLSIPGGALVALLGPSGSGKTTLLRILGGLEYPTSGRVLFDGHDATGMTVQERRAGFVFQSYALFRHMTVFDNIAYGLNARPRASRPSRAEIARRVTKLLDLIQLPQIADRYPSQLSGGQRQRVALARALAIEPRMLLLDEPFGALDAKVRKELRQGLREIHDETGLTTVFVTHDQDEAMELADLVVVMSMGRIEQIGRPRTSAPVPPLRSSATSSRAERRGDGAGYALAGGRPKVPITLASKSLSDRLRRRGTNCSASAPTMTAMSLSGFSMISRTARAIGSGEGPSLMACATIGTKCATSSR